MFNIWLNAVRASGAASPSSLLTGLVSYWKMDEASGARADSVGANTLTDNNTVGSDTLWGTVVADFIRANSEYLSIASNPDFEFGDSDFTFLFELDGDALIGSGLVQAIVDKRSPTVSNYSFIIYDAKADWYVVGSTNNVARVDTGLLANPTRYICLCWHDSVNDISGLRINNLGSVEVNTSGPLLDDGGGALVIGARLSTGGDRYFDGRMRNVASWNRVLTEAEQDLVINGGFGIPYPFEYTVPITDIGTNIALDGYGTTYANAAPHTFDAASSITIAATDYQAVVYWNQSKNLVVGKRTLPSGAWTFYTYDGTGGLANISMGIDDYHKNAVIGIDPDGYIHVSYGHHNEALNYRKSTAPINSWAGAMTAEISMLGTNEAQVTYQAFFNDPAGTLYFMFRDGISGLGDTYLYTYDEGATTWGGATGAGTAGILIDGKNSTPTQNAYWARPAFDADFASGGHMHFGWWFFGGNIMSYTKWDGTSFYQADGSPQTVPITLANSETVVASVDDVYHQNYVYPDASGNPHVMYRTAVGGGGYNQLWHLYHNGSAWSTPVQVTSYSADANSGGKGVFFYHDGQINIIHREGNNPNRSYVRRYAASPYSSWSSETLLSGIGYAFGNSSINPDWQRWSRDSIMDLFMAFQMELLETGSPVQLYQWSPS